jgi:hypothetical protein
MATPSSTGAGAAAAAVPALAQEAVMVESEAMPEGSVTVEGYDFNQGVDYHKLLEVHTDTSSPILTHPHTRSFPPPPAHAHTHARPLHLGCICTLTRAIACSHTFVQDSRPQISGELSKRSNGCGSGGSVTNRSNRTRWSTPPS